MISLRIQPKGNWGYSMKLESNCMHEAFQINIFGKQEMKFYLSWIIKINRNQKWIDINITAETYLSEFPRRDFLKTCSPGTIHMKDFGTA